MFIVLILLFITSIQAKTEEKLIPITDTKTLAQLDAGRLQALKNRLDFDDFLAKTDSFDQLALQETFAQTPSQIPPLFHYVWLGGPLYEDYWSSITRLATLLKKARSPARVVVWVDDLKNLEFLKERENDRALKTMNEGLSTYEPLLDIKKIDQLKNKKPDFFTDAQYVEYWNIIDFERHGLRNLAAASDMIRLEILRQCGGVYLDTDMTPLFFGMDRLPASLFKAPHNFQIINRTNSLITSTPGHPLIKSMIRHVLIAYVDNFLQMQEKRRTDVALRKPSDRIKNKRFYLTIIVSGPGAFYGRLASKIHDPLQMDKLILKIQDDLVSPYVLVPKEFCATIGCLLSAEMFGDVPESTVAKMQSFIVNHKKNPYLDSTAFLTNVLMLFNKPCCAEDMSPILLKAYNILLILLEKIQNQPIRPVLRTQKGSQIQRFDGMHKNLGSVIYHYEASIIELYKSGVSYLGGIQKTTLFGCLNFKFDCHNTWMGGRYVFPPFDTDSLWHDYKIKID